MLYGPIMAMLSMAYVLLVYVGTGEGTSKPTDPIANMTLISSCMPEKASSLGFLSLVRQLVQPHTLNAIVGHGNNTWNSTLDSLPLASECYC